MSRLRSAAAAALPSVRPASLGAAPDAADPKRLLALAESMAGVGTWRYDVASRRVTWSDEVARIHGCDPSSFIPGVAEVLACYADDDRELISASMDRAVQTGEGFDLRLRLRLPARPGFARYVRARATVERNAAGSVEAVIGVFRDVTEEVLAVERAEAGERQARALAAERLEAVRRADLAERVGRVGHWRYDLADKRLETSAQMRVLLGFEPATAPTRAEALLRVHEDDREALRDLARRVRAGEPAGERLVVRLRPTPDRLVLVEPHVFVERDGEGRPLAVFASVRDVTETVVADRAARETQQRYRFVSEHVNDLVLHLDGTARVTYASPAVERITGWTVEEVTGRSGLDFVHPDDLERVSAILVDLLSGAFAPDPGWAIEYRLLKRDGTFAWVESHPALTRDAGGAIEGFSDVIRDIGVRKTLEDRLRSALAEAEAASAAKSEFLSNISHELRTPLTSIIGFSELLKGPLAGSETGLRHLDHVLSASRTLLAIINDVLDVSKLEAGRMKPVLQPTSPVGLTMEAVELFRREAETKGLSLVFECGGEPPRRALLDEAKVRQILLALIGNAMKFTEAGSIRVRLIGVDGRLRYEVVDTGCGIPADRSGRLFERFSQVDGSTTRQYGGAGLGLAIARGLVEVLGGEIGVESREGEGSRFWFDIPAQDAGEEAAATAGEIGDFDLAGLRVLVTDDNPMNRELVRALLGAVGAEIAEADSGEAAVETAAAQVFDLILMDVRMPGMGGVAAARAIRDGGGPNDLTPILAFTADVWTGGAEDDVFSDAISKPVTADGLLEAVARWAPGAEPLAAA